MLLEDNPVVLLVPVISILSEDSNTVLQTIGRPLPISSIINIKFDFFGDPQMSLIHFSNLSKPEIVLVCIFVTTKIYYHR